MEKKYYKSGFVNIIGNPNVGKSTLMNKLIGERLSIITSKAQTTRHRILGIVNDENYQIVFSDTPGIIQPNYNLQSSMMKFVRSAFQDADVFLYMVEIGNSSLKDSSFFERLKNTDIPILLLINKIDKSNQQGVEKAMNHWQSKLPKAKIIPISAIEGFGLDKIMAELTITIKVSDTDQTVLKNDLLDIDTWVQDAMTGKINNCWKRMQREWTTKLMNDESFTDSIPSNKADFVTLITSRSDYKDRKARDEANKIG